jgi:hypothetical protein
MATLDDDPERSGDRAENCDDKGGGEPLVVPIRGDRHGSDSSDKRDGEQDEARPEKVVLHGNASAWKRGAVTIRGIVMCIPHGLPFAMISSVHDRDIDADGRYMSKEQIAPMVVMSHTTVVVASQETTPLMLTPSATDDARPSATTVTARPVHPRSSEA